MIAIVAAITAIVALFVYFFKIMPAQSYSKAQKLFADKQYSQAAKAFTDLGDYEDAIAICVDLPLQHTADWKSVAKLQVHLGKVRSDCISAILWSE